MCDKRFLQASRNAKNALWQFFVKNRVTIQFMWQFTYARKARNARKVRNVSKARNARFFLQFLALKKQEIAIEKFETCDNYCTCLICETMYHITAKMDDRCVSLSRIPAAGMRGTTLHSGTYCKKFPILLVQMLVLAIFTLTFLGIFVDVFKDLCWYF